MNYTLALITHVKKVNKIVLPIIIIGAITAIGLKVFFKQPVPLYAILILTISSIVSAVPIYVIKRFENMSMYILTLSFSIFAIISFLNAPSLAVVILVLMLAYTLAALYLNKSLIMVNSFVTFIALFFIQYMIKALFNSSDFVTVIFLLVLINISLFYLAKSGRQLIFSAYEEEVRAKSILSELEKTIDSINMSSTTLKSDITKGNDIIGVVYEITSSMTKAIQEIATGVTNQTESVTHISGMMSEAEDKLSDVTQFSKQLRAVS